MYVLILLSCLGINCEHMEVLGEYSDLKACEAVMIEKIEDIKDEQGLMCLPKELVDRDIIV